MLKKQKLFYTCTTILSFVAIVYYLSCCKTKTNQTKTEILNNSQAKANTNKKTDHSPIRPLEQEKLKQTFANNTSYKQALGLFSYGGWTDDGQFWLLIKDHSCTVKISPTSPTNEKFKDGLLKYKTQEIAIKTCKDLIDSLKFTDNMNNYHITVVPPPAHPTVVKRDGVEIEADKNESQLL